MQQGRAAGSPLRLYLHRADVGLAACTNGLEHLVPAPDAEICDFIVVGAGSAGCVLADRLSADAHSTVLVLEFGGSDRSVLIQIPAALSIPMNMTQYNWGDETEAEPCLGGRGVPCPRR